MRKMLAAAILYAGVIAPAVAQVSDASFCAPELNETRLLACAQSAPPNSAKAALAFANLGTVAYARNDFETAAWYYLQSMPGRSIVDIILHTNRADVMSMMDGGTDAAIADASIALRMAREGKDRNGPITVETKWTVLPRLVQVLDLSDDKTPRDQAATMLLALPANSADDFSDRAVVFAMTGKLNESLVAIDKAIKLAPNVAMLRNNRCATLLRLNRGAEALKSCKEAYAIDSANRAIMRSLADAYSRNDRCNESAPIVTRYKQLFPDDGWAETFECPRN